MMLGKKIKTILNIIKNIIIVVIAVILGFIIIQRITGNNVNFLGYTMYTVGSESMLPEYEIGDMFLSKKVEIKSLKVDDDIVYMGKVGTYANKIITHRIIKITDEKITTKGINNPVEDAPIDFDQVYGKVVIRLPILSMFSKMMNNSVVFYVVIFIPFSLLLFFDLKGIISDRKELAKSKTGDNVENSSNEVETNVSSTDNDNNTNDEHNVV